MTVDIDTISTLPQYDIEWEKEVPYNFDGLPIVIEYLEGDTRTKTSTTGFVIKGIMPAAYGRILGTTDAHGEEIDMYLAAMASHNVDVYVVDQIDPKTGIFDEHKVMLGFTSCDEAEHVYKQVFADGSGEKRLGALTCFTLEAFKTWLAVDGTAFKPACDYKADGVMTVGSITVVTDAKVPQAPRDEAGGVLVPLIDLSQGPKIVTMPSDTDKRQHHLYLYSALDMKLWSNLVDTLCRLLDFATVDDILHIHIASPGGSVILMGRIVSAIQKTKAKVVTYAEGGVASAATAVWAAGHERHIFPGAYFMQHMSSQLLAGKTTDIAAKSIFCMSYIEEQLRDLVELKLFTAEEVNDMIEKSADIYISGREAIDRVGAVSYTL